MLVISTSAYSLEVHSHSYPLGITSANKRRTNNIILWKMTVTYFKCEEVEFEELLKSTASNRWRLKTNEKRQINERKKKSLSATQNKHFGFFFSAKRNSYLKFTSTLFAQLSVIPLSQDILRLFLLLLFVCLFVCFQEKNNLLAVCFCGGLFIACEKFSEHVRQFIPHLRFFFFFLVS